MRTIATVFLFGFLLFSYHHMVKPAAKGGKKAIHLAYRAVV